MTRQLDLTVQGVVGTNPVLSRVGEKARPYCRFRVAVTPTYRTEQGWNNTDTIWFTVKAWGQLAANLSHSVRKGDAVLLTGRFSQESWENDGRKHETNVITLQAAGHDLTRGESHFARVRVVESAPSASSGASAGDAVLDSDVQSGSEPRAESDSGAGQAYHVSADHWDTVVTAGSADGCGVPEAQTTEVSPESCALPSDGPTRVVGSLTLQDPAQEKRWSAHEPAYEIADDLVEQADE